MINWQFHDFNTLNATQLFQVLKLRVDVFVVEQQCAYPEIDENDNAPTTIHLLGYTENELAAYARAMPYRKKGSDNKPSNVRIGRVVVAKPFRGKGVADRLMQEMIDHLADVYPSTDLCLSAQSPLVSFYEAFRFNVESEEYLEDGIPHIDMRRSV